MGTLLMLLGGLLVLVAVFCSIIILIDAFQNEVWKGILYLLCGIYQLYYIFVEFQHERKWLIIAGAMLGGLAGYLLLFAGGATSVGGR